MRASKVLGMAACLALATALGACYRAPAGDAAATVNGDTISRTDLQLEAQGSGTGADDDATQQALLAQVVNRKLLAQEAVAEKVDQTPAFKVAEQKAREAALAEALADKLAGGKPSAAAIRNFVAENPKMFSGREALTLDQLQVDAGAVDGRWLQPAKTFDDAERILTEHKVAFRRGHATADTAAMPPQLLKVLADRPNEPFAIPAGDKLVISQVTAREKTPVPADQVDQLAGAEIRRRAYQKAIGDKLKALRDKARITYGAGFSAPPAGQQ